MKQIDFWNSCVPWQFCTVNLQGQLQVSEVYENHASATDVLILSAPAALRAARPKASSFGQKASLERRRRLASPWDPEILVSNNGMSLPCSLMHMRAHFSLLGSRTHVPQSGFEEDTMAGNMSPELGFLP